METILVERREGIVTATLNRPEVLNAATSETWVELTELCREVARNPEDRVLVITGAGDAFCSGAHLGGFTDASVPRLVAMRSVADAAAALISLPKPSIAKVNGVAAGAGANMAFACDLVVAADTARFCEIFARRGLSVDFGGSWLLPRLVGLQQAKRLVLLTEMISAAEALELGLVTKVVPRADLDGAVDDWATRLKNGPPLALSLSKALLNDSMAMSVHQALEAEGMAQCHNFASSDIKEALAAWQERREPHFTGW